MKKLISIFENEVTGRLSSKRVFGAIGFITYMVMCYAFDKCIEQVGYISAGLLGLGLTENLINKFKTK